MVLNHKTIPPKVQVVFGLGAPITLQDNITSFPSRTVEFCGSFSIIGPVAVKRNK